MITPLAIALLSMGAITHDVALLAPGKPPREADQNELRTARDAAASVSRMLDELGIHADTLGQEGLLDGGLRQRQVVILAYNPYLDEQAAGALSRFVQSGGKLLVCYLLPPRLAGRSASTMSSTSASSGRGSLPRSVSTPTWPGCRNRSGRTLGTSWTCGRPATTPG